MAPSVTEKLRFYQVTSLMRCFCQYKLSFRSFCGSSGADK